MRRIAVAAIILLALPAAAMAEGMPQLDFKNPLTTSQVVWLVFIFSALYFLLSRWGLPKVADVLEARAVSIAQDLEAAQKAKAASDLAVAASNEATRAAHAEAQAEISASVARAKESAAAQAAELERPSGGPARRRRGTHRRGPCVRSGRVAAGRDRDRRCGRHPSDRPRAGPRPG